MGYIKTIEYGDTVEVYKYEKPLPNFPKQKKQSKLAIKRRQAIRKLPTYTPTERSIRRAKNNFRRLCHHNNVHSNSISFFTLTFAISYNHSSYTRALSVFIKNINKKYESKAHFPITYIGVPELTKKGRTHYHLLVYNLPPSVVENERYTRNFQRLWQRGYLDARRAYDTSPKIASYMAKYMAKHFSTPGNSFKRAYSCSRNIKKVNSFGIYSPDEYSNLVTGDLPPFQKNELYNTPYMGMCIKSIYKK